ncbi:MAG: hypothetical protein ACRC6V_10040 [Bacteroidales bacterium]
MTLPTDLKRLPFPVVTPEAKKFWASKHTCNRAKACIAFSKTREQAHRLMKRWLPSFCYHKRERAWNAWQNHKNMPTMEMVPFTPMSIPWWECLPRTPEPPPVGHWALWMDDKNWVDTSSSTGADNKWVEWLGDGEEEPWETLP